MKLSNLWKTRAAVNKEQLNLDGLTFDPSKKDFTASLLPFHSHDAWLDAPEQAKDICLSYAWGLYNLKTIYIECDIVTPACEDIIKSPPSSSRNAIQLQETMSEALLDEALHTRMSLLASNYIYRERGLTPYNFDRFNLITWRRELLASCNAEWQRRLSRFAIACASETLITDYLKVMAEDNSIQSICHEVTRTHAEDEWSHSSVFSLVARDIVSGLSRSEKNYLAKTMKSTVKMFANNELEAWSHVFNVAGIKDYKDIIHDTGNTNEINVYTKSVDTVIEKIGLDIMENEVVCV